MKLLWNVNWKKKLSLILVLALSPAAHAAVDLTAREPAFFPSSEADHLEEYQLGNMPAVILAYKNFQLGETYTLNQARGKSVNKSDRIECRFLAYASESDDRIALTITGFLRSQDNPKEIWIEGRLSGSLPQSPSPSADISDSYCRNNQKILLRAEELSDLQGATPQSLKRLQRALENISAS